MAAPKEIDFEGATLRVPQKPTKADPQQLAALAQKFQIEQKVITHLTEVLKMESLHDLLYMVSNESEVSAIISAVGLSKEQEPLQTSRLRRAWASLRDASIESAKAREASAQDQDLDTLVAPKDLAAAQATFWRRHRLHLPSCALPSDQLLSRLIREQNLRLFSIRPISKCTSQLSTIQVTSTSAAAPRRDTLAAYLQGLRTLMLGYAIAGCRALPKEGNSEETEDSNPIEHVEIPLETTLKYFFRAEERAYKMADQRGTQAAMQWLKVRDEQDRSSWVEVHRQSSLTLGQVIDRIQKLRESTWLVDDLPIPAPPAASSASLTPSGAALPRDFQPTMKDGRPLCIAFNFGSCSEPCPLNHLHVCGKLVRGSNRICGMRNHSYTEHIRRDAQQQQQQQQQPQVGNKRKGAGGGKRR